MLDFSADADIVAPLLLGRTLSFGSVTIEITEVEAYLHGTDTAAHSFRGKTPANAALWGAGRTPIRLYFLWYSSLLQLGVWSGRHRPRLLASLWASACR